jgi:hypothetical protein
MWLRRTTCYDRPNAQLKKFKSTLEMYFHAILLGLVEILYYQPKINTYSIAYGYLRNWVRYSYSAKTSGSARMSPW